MKLIAKADMRRRWLFLADLGVPKADQGEARDGSEQIRKIAGKRRFSANKRAQLICALLFAV